MNGPCRTTTALGAPVVPDVYMMSVGPSGPTSSGPPEPSPPDRSDHAPDGSSSTTATHGGRAEPGSGPPPRSTPRLTTTNDGSAWSRMARNSGPANRVLTGTAVAPARWAAT